MDYYTNSTGGSAPRIQSERPVGNAIMRGLFNRCPNCGQGKLFRSFLKPHHACSSCQQELHHQRADDFPPYIVIFIVGHIVVAGYMFTDTNSTWTSWQHLSLWIPVTIVSALLLLQPVKGAVIGMQWALRMHGFGGAEPPLDPVPEERS